MNKYDARAVAHDLVGADACRFGPGDGGRIHSHSTTCSMIAGRLVVAYERGAADERARCLAAVENAEGAACDAYEWVRDGYDPRNR